MGYNILMFRIITIKEPITRAELKELAHEGFEDVVKVVVDIEKEIVAAGGELHVDMQVKLMESEESTNENTWGINLYVNEEGESFLEFDSMINLKPSLGNKTRGVENKETRRKITEIINRLVK